MCHILGSILEPESVCTEYKEFRLELSYSFEERSEPECLFYDDTRMEQMFTDILHKNIKKYTGKYSTAFYNSDMAGSVKIGVTDLGEIIGVPIRKEKLSSILQSVNSIFKNELINNVVPYVGLENHAKIVFHEIDPQNLMYYSSPTTRDYLEAREKALTDFEMYKKDYSQAKKRFVETLSRYRQGLNVIINDLYIRGEFKNFLKENNAFHMFEQILDDANSICFADAEVKIKKHDKNELIYWLALFRDICTDNIVKNLRPIWNSNFKKVDPYYGLLQEFRPLISELLYRGYSMYIIEMVFPYLTNKKIKSLRYYDYNNPDELRKCFRGCNLKGFPCCVPDS